MPCRETGNILSKLSNYSSVLPHTCYTLFPFSHISPSGTTKPRPTFQTHTHLTTIPFIQHPHPVSANQCIERPACPFQSITETINFGTLFLSKTQSVSTPLIFLKTKKLTLLSRKFHNSVQDHKNPFLTLTTSFSRNHISKFASLHSTSSYL